ncbi:MAG TPA: purine-nucleoside phosphorylase [Vicinamibacterales bacterium]
MTSQPLGFDEVEAAASWIRERAGGRAPEIAVVLGSGLGGFFDRITDAFTCEYGDVPKWPASAVAGHAGRLGIGRLGGKTVAVLSGRVHLYEGHEIDRVVFATRVMARLGVKTIILTNAAGGINPAFGKGALMVIDDHINFLGRNPLTGANDDRFGVRFPDMTEVYSARLRRIAGEASAACGVAVQHGVYIAVPGPSYETPAEIRAFRTLGADAVGMSTVPEAIAARHMGLEVLGISCITNMAAGMLPETLNHEEVFEIANRVKGAFTALLEGIIERV